MPPRRGRSRGKYPTGRKYHRGYYVGTHYSRRHGGLGFFGAIFFLILGLVIFGNEDEKKVGWGIITGILVLCLIASAGPAAPLVIILIIVAGIALLSGLSVKSGTYHPPVKTEEPVMSPVNVTTDKRDSTSKNITPASATSPVHKNPYRYEESKHERKNKSPVTVKTMVKPVEEPRKTSVEPIEIKDSGLVKGMAIGEMEWTHMEKGQIVDEEIPKQEFFQSIEEAKKEYDIPEDYIRIMIETNTDGSIKECPALVWKDNFFLNMLPLVKKSNISCWSVKKFKEVTYKVLSEVDPDSRYNDIGMAALATEFEDRFPEYMFNGQYGTHTGVFMFTESIEITNTSAKAMFELLEPEFILEDAVTSSDKYEPEMKEIYKANLLWKNGVIDTQEYNRIKEISLENLKERVDSRETISEQIELAKEMGVILE